MRSRYDRQRGLTLVEVLIAGFVLVVILTVAFGSMINVTKGVRSGQGRLTMQHTAQMIADQTLKVLAYAVPVDSLDQSPENVQPVFEKHRLRLISSDSYAANGLQWVEIETADSEYGAQAGIRRSDLGELMTKESPKLLGLSPDRFSATIDLRYKLDASSDETVEMTPNGQHPALVLLTITVIDKDEDLPDFTLETAADLQ